jgi:ATP synthase in type III secretion protein N
VLVEGGDMDEPIADEVRGILDGHVVLDRTLGARGRYPAVDVLVSLSRVMSTVASEKHVQSAQKIRALLAAYESKKDLLALGAYVKGTDPEFDEAIVRMPKIEQFLRQDARDRVAFEDAVTLLDRALV